MPCTKLAEATAKLVCFTLPSPLIIAFQLHLAISILIFTDFAIEIVSEQFTGKVRRRPVPFRPFLSFLSSPLNNPNK